MSSSENHGRRTHRTSLWRRLEPGHWQIFHHQGTITNPLTDDRHPLHMREQWGLLDWMATFCVHMCLIRIACFIFDAFAYIASLCA
jgi:hypothetical protein